MFNCIFKGNNTFTNGEINGNEEKSCEQSRTGYQLAILLEKYYCWVSRSVDLGSRSGAAIHPIMGSCGEDLLGCPPPPHIACHVESGPLSRLLFRPPVVYKYTYTETINNNSTSFKINKTVRLGLIKIQT